MAYRDPYAAQYGRHQQPHATYDEGAYDNYGSGYRDDPTDARGPQRQATTRSHISTGSVDAPMGVRTRDTDTVSGFDHGEFPPKEKVPQTLKSYRHETQGNLWTRGGRPRCIGRFCCCTLLIAVFLILSIILSLALWIRPPNVTIGDIELVSSGGSEFELTNDGVNINLGVNITVDNPNYFSLDLKKVTAELFYPLNSTSTGTDIGGGNSSNINFAAHSQTNFTFPFEIEYTQSNDPSNAILISILEKCGILGTSSNLDINYKITLGIRILMVTVSPVISNSFSFACPLNSTSLSDLMSSSGLNLTSIAGLLGE
ncbi:uncharacterized protein BT62DRAFT_743406 [Guyanagaster necrorhizus]|uniref:Late embryogenesis abundant protein LEA-2 subgroup domain-containing protein n=1 Tax=Guyanagaster necrorhizus TaxID=856835 RepID=A0A9P8AUD6_9AGAR|nr:uncharacterized protein BT62DRAFT_743406 [Guyanagaster necrorhizus MCA 3950]KAG7447936.1 hypothetical protein BT62DRAFT_743406 [Guyanagaster necrorhizus MCA 3950]